MVFKAEQQRLKSLLSETIILLCKNGLNFHNEICIEGLIGITLDQEEIFLVNIKESIVPAEVVQVGVDEVARIVDSVSTRLPPVNNARDHRRRRAHHDVKPNSFAHDIAAPSNPKGINLNEELPLVVCEPATEATSSGECFVSFVKEEKDGRPATKRDIDCVGEGKSMDDLDEKIRNNLGSDMSPASSASDLDSSPLRAKKRRRSNASKEPCTSVASHEVSPTGPATLLSNGSELHDNKQRPEVGEQSENIKLENTDLIEIPDDESSAGDELLEDGGGCGGYDEYDGGVYGMGGGMDDDGGMDGYVLGSRHWQTFSDSRVDGGSTSQQDVLDLGLGCLPEDQLPSCTYCGQQFNEVSHLYTHACPLRNTKQVSKLKKSFPSKFHRHVIPPPIYSEERPFECATCLKRFTTLFNRQRHELTHTGVRPFECALCHKRFTQLANLRAHDRIHLKESSSFST